MDRKYVVFKEDEWDAYKAEFERSAPVNLRLPNPVRDAHVIREQDVFAPGVLATYAGAVQTAIEVIEQQGAEVPHYLFEARDHFFMASNSSAMRPRKLPD